MHGDQQIVRMLVAGFRQTIFVIRILKIKIDILIKLKLKNRILIEYNILWVMPIYNNTICVVCSLPHIENIG